MRRIEHYHHTPEQVRGYIEEALQIVADLELDDELGQLAFTHAVNLLSAKQIVFEQVTVPVPDLSVRKGGR
jgi:hypothetical protein